MQAIGKVGEHSGDAPIEQSLHVFFFIDSIRVNEQSVFAHLLDVCSINLIKVHPETDAVRLIRLKLVIRNGRRPIVPKQLHKRDARVQAVNDL